MTNKTEVFTAHQEHPEWHAGAIARHLGCDSGYVRATAKRIGITLPRKRRQGVKLGSPRPIMRFSGDEVSSLPNHQGDVLSSRADGLTYAQIAERHGIAIGTVKSRIARARDRMIAQREVAK